MAYKDFNDLTRRRSSDKILCDEVFNFTKNLKYDGYQRGLASMVYNIFDKKVSGVAIKNENISNKKLTQEIHKTIIRKLKKKQYIHIL